MTHRYVVYVVLLAQGDDGWDALRANSLEVCDQIDSLEDTNPELLDWTLGISQLGHATAKQSTTPLAPVEMAVTVGVPSGQDRLGVESHAGGVDACPGARYHVVHRGPSRALDQQSRTYSCNDIPARAARAASSSPTWFGTSRTVMATLMTLFQQLHQHFSCSGLLHR